MKSIFILFLSLSLGLTACSSTPLSSKSIEIVSNPPHADVLSAQGEVIGKTPLTLNNSDLVKMKNPSDGEWFQFSLHLSGYLSSDVLIESRGQQSISVNLTPLDKSLFATTTSRTLMSENNQIIRDLLSIQGLIVRKQTDEAEQALKKFIAQYPSIASAYVLSANVALMKKRPEEARNYLIRAQTLDPNDPVAERLLRKINSETNRPRGSL